MRAGWAGLWLLGGCAPDSAADPVASPGGGEPLALEEAAEQVTFASTEQLGPHRYRAEVERIEQREGREVSRHTEVVEIRWESWDAFAYVREVDARPVAEVVVVDGAGWSRRPGGGGWEAVEDPEVHRQQLRLTWNTWEQVLDPFGEQVELRREGQEEREGRGAIRYAVVLAPESTEEPEAEAGAEAGAVGEGEGEEGGGARRRGGRARRSTFKPASLEGTLWLDEATAVGLSGQVTGALERGDYRRVTTLRLERTGIGTAQDIKPPESGEGSTP